MVYLTREMLEHHRERRRVNMITTGFLVAIVAGAAFMALFWWTLLF